MKNPQSLSILTLSLSLLISSSVLASYPSTATKQIILHVESSNYDIHSKLYIAETMDENGDIYIIQSFDDISGQWLDATINQNYEITNYTIME